MNSKFILSLVLILFVIASLSAVILQETQVIPVTTSLHKGDEPAVQNSDAPPQQVVVYYLHGTARCVTCKKIESYTEEALHWAFEGEIHDKLLVWKEVNVELPGNEHLVTDYQIHTKSVVLSRIQNGQEVRWKNLDQVWNLIQDKASFITYIQNETRTFLGESHD